MAEQAAKADDLVDEAIDVGLVALTRYRPREDTAASPRPSGLPPQAEWGLEHPEPPSI